MSQDKPKGEVFLFEDIMREFGGKIPPAQTTAAPPVEKEPAVTESEENMSEKPSVETLKKTEKPKVIPLPKVAEQALPTEKQVEKPEPPKVEPPKAPVRPPRERAKRPEPKPKKLEVGAGLSLFEANKQVGSGGTLRSHIIGFLGFLAVIMTLSHGLGYPMGVLEATPQTLPMVLLAMLLLSTCLALDLMKDGIFHIISLKIRLDALLTVAVVVFLIHGFGAVRQEALPYASIGILGLSFGLSGKSMENRSKKKIYRGMISQRNNPTAIVVSSDVYEESEGVWKREGDVQEVVAPMEKRSMPDGVLGVFGLVTVVVSAAAAVGIGLWRGENFIAIWAAILGGSLPIYGLVAFWKPFWKGSCQLAKSGTVLCGWTGVQRLGKKPKPVATEQDLFTGNQVSVNGMKVYPEFDLREIVGYVHAVMVAGGGGLETVFGTLHQQQNGHQYTVNQFKRYDNGGLGAEIQSDVVLVGSLNFMNLMGVRMPDGANMRQAVYCSVNGVLAGVFAMNYQPSAMVKNAMHQYVRSGGGGLILATKDFILTPAAVRHFYKVPSGWVEFPSADQRAQIAQGEVEAGTTVGLMARLNFGALLEAATVGKWVYAQSMTGLSISMLWGITGLVLTSAVSALGASGVASPFNLTIFALLWSFAAWVITALQRK